MNRSSFNKMVVPGLFSFADAGYKRKNSEAIWKQLVTVKNSSRAYEESAYYGGLGLPVIKPEGKEVTYDNFAQGYTKRWNHVTYGLATRITEEAIEDCLYPDIPTTMEAQTREIGSSFAELFEVLVHDLFNNGTSTTYHTAGDALALFSASHVNLRGGLWSNLLSPAADLSATALQTAIDNMALIKDDSGKYQIIKPKYLLVHLNNVWKAEELLESSYDPESPNNSINTLKKRNLQIIASPFYTDTDAFTIIAEPPNSDSGIIAFMRRKPKFAQDGDFETGDFKFKGTCRFSVEVNKPNNLYHSAGA